MTPLPVRIPQRTVSVRTPSTIQEVHAIARKSYRAALKAEARYRLPITRKDITRLEALFAAVARRERWE